MKEHICIYSSYISLTQYVHLDTQYLNTVEIRKGLYHGTHIRWQLVAHVWRKIGLCGEKYQICDRMTYTDHITEIAPNARTYFWVTIYKNNVLRQSLGSGWISEAPPWTCSFFVHSVSPQIFYCIQYKMKILISNLGHQNWFILNKI